MRSHSFQDTELKLYRNVNDSPGQVVDGLAILRYPEGLRNKGLITQKTQLLSPTGYRRIANPSTTCPCEPMTYL